MSDKTDRPVQDRQPAADMEAAPLRASLPDEPTPEALQARIHSEADREGKYLTASLKGNMTSR